MTRRLLPLLLAAGCGGSADGTTPGAIRAEPFEVGLFGHETVELHLPTTALPSTPRPIVRVAGALAYDVAWVSPGVLRATVQGAPQAGPADVVVDVGETHLESPGAITYRPQRVPEIGRLIATGGSLTEGVHDGTVDVDGQSTGGAAVIARQVGAYLPLPLVPRGIIPGYTAASFRKDCTVAADPDLAGFLDSLLDPDTGEYSVRRGRIDPSVEVFDVAIGGETLADQRDGGPGAKAVLENLTWNVEAESPIVGPPVPQIARVKALASAVPHSTIISLDLATNDVLGTLGTNDAGFTLETITPADQFRKDARFILGELAALPAEVFIADIPYVDFKPDFQEHLARMRANGADADGAVTALRARTDELNAILAEEGARFPNVHVLPIASRVKEIARDGVMVGGERLDVSRFGGLLGFDDTHFTRTGYALVADYFIQQMNQTLGTHIPAPDLEAIHAADPQAPAALRALGFSCKKP